MADNFSIDEIMGFNPSDLSVFNETASTNYDVNVYKTKPSESKAEDGHYRSRIRVIYNPFNFKRSIVPQATYYITDTNGGLLVRSKLANGDKNCPLFKAWKQLHFNQDKTQYNINGQMYTKKEWGDHMYDKTESQWVLVQILEDDNQPELVGQIKVMKLPKAIFVKMNAKMNPSPESKKVPIPVMDYLIGLPLDIDVTPGPDDPNNPQRKQREISYDLCEFDSDYAPIINVDGTPFFADAEMELIDAYSTALTDVSKAKTAKKQEDAKAKLAELHEPIKALYAKALAYLKENAVNLEDECAYKEWDEETTKRIMNWIEVVAAMKDPQTTASVNDSVENNESKASEPQETNATDISASMMSETTDSEVPF